MKIKTSIFLFFVFIGFHSKAQILEIEFTTSEERVGLILFQVLDKEEQLVFEQIIPVTEGVISTSIDELKPGTYSIMAFHDLNSNVKLDKYWYGAPSEPYGFSNNARGKFGPPSQESQLFELVSVAEQRIHLK